MSETPIVKSILQALRPGDAERLWRRVDRRGPDDCWVWKGARNRLGYGMIRIRGRANTITSRMAYELTYGPLAPGQLALHRCDNPPCCNPRHLFAGTEADNIADRQAKGRSSGGSLPGSKNPQSKLTEQQVVEIKALLAAGGLLQREIAALYGVSNVTICDIKIGRKWSHVP